MEAKLASLHDLFMYILGNLCSVKIFSRCFFLVIHCFKTKHLKTHWLETTTSFAYKCVVCPWPNF